MPSSHDPLLLRTIRAVQSVNRYVDFCTEPQLRASAVTKLAAERNEAYVGQLSQVNTGRFISRVDLQIHTRQINVPPVQQRTAISDFVLY